MPRRDRWAEAVLQGTFPCGHVLRETGPIDQRRYDDDASTDAEETRRDAAENTDPHEGEPGRGIGVLLSNEVAVPSFLTPPPVVNNRGHKATLRSTLCHPSSLALLGFLCTYELEL